MLAITFVQCTYSDIPETNHVPTVQCCSCSVFTVCGTVPTCNVISHVKHIPYWYITTSRSQWAVPDIAVFCSSLISYFPGLLFRYCPSDCEMFPVARIVTSVTSVLTFHMR